MNIYQITTEYRQIMAMLEQSEGELTPEIEDALRINECCYRDKLKGYAMVVLDYSAKAESISAEITRLARLKKTAENNIARLKDSMLSAMVEFCPGGKEDFGCIKLCTRKSESVEIVDASIIPEQYMIASEPKISRDLIREALKSGLEVQGAIMKQNINLNIK